MYQLIQFLQPLLNKSALITITEKIRKAIDNREVACSVFLDQQKAFDTVDDEVSRAL